MTTIVQRDAQGLPLYISRIVEQLNAQMTIAKDLRHIVFKVQRSISLGGDWWTIFPEFTTNFQTPPKILKHVERQRCRRIELGNSEMYAIDTPMYQMSFRNDSIRQWSEDTVGRMIADTGVAIEIFDFIFDGNRPKKRMTAKEALSKVLEDMEKMSPEEIRTELEKHRDGELATAIRETQAFITRFDGVKK